MEERYFNGYVSRLEVYGGNVIFNDGTRKFFTIHRDFKCWTDFWDYMKAHKIADSKRIYNRSEGFKGEF